MVPDWGDLVRAERRGGRAGVKLGHGMRGAGSATRHEPRSHLPRRMRARLDIWGAAARRTPATQGPGEDLRSGTGGSGWLAVCHERLAHSRPERAPSLAQRR